MRILHILPTGGMGWSGGIRQTLRGLADSPLGQRHVFEAVGLPELSRALVDWQPDRLIWHGACSWRAIPRLLAHRRYRQILFEHHYCAGFERHNVPSLLRFRTMLRLCYGAMDGVVSVSRGQYAWMAGARLLPSSRQSLLPSSRILTDFLALPPPVPRPGRDFTLLAYGRLTVQKGFDRLIRALRYLPNRSVRLQVAGDGPEREALEVLAKSDKRIQFIGARHDIPALMSTADAVVIPSRWEPWGNVCLEARAAGRPVLVSDTDGLPEQVNGVAGPCGLIVQGDSDSALACALETLLSASPQMRRAWSDAGRLSACHAWHDYIGSWEQLLDAFP